MLITSTTLGSATDATTATVCSAMPYARGFVQEFASPPILHTAYNLIFTVCSDARSKTFCCQKFLSSIIKKVVKVVNQAVLASNISGNPAIFTVGAGAIPKNSFRRAILSIPVENFLNPTAFLYYIWRVFFGQLARFASIFNQFSYKHCIYIVYTMFIHQITLDLTLTLILTF
jgi:hypothetical protein